MRRTKIVCTIGPATGSEAPLRALLVRGMNVARLKFSHGDHAWHADLLGRVRSFADELRRRRRDLAGPRRTQGGHGPLADGSVEL